MLAFFFCGDGDDVDAHQTTYIVRIFSRPRNSGMPWFLLSYGFFSQRAMYLDNLRRNYRQVMCICRSVLPLIIFGPVLHGLPGVCCDS